MGRKGGHPRTAFAARNRLNRIKEAVRNGIQTQPQPTSQHIYQLVNGVLKLNLHQGQAQVWKCTKRIILVLAGTQSGKTVMGPLWLYSEMQRRGPGVYLAASANYDVMRLKMLPELLKFFVSELGYTHKLSARTLVSPDKHYEIVMRSADSPAGLESATANAAWLDEWGLPNVTLECWEAILRRLSIAQGRILITTTPYNIGWLKTAVYDKAIDGDPDYAVISFPSLANPAFPKEEYEAAKNRMPEWRFRMFYEGVFARPAAMIYSDYDDSYAEFKPTTVPGYNTTAPGPGEYVAGGNLVEPFVIPPHWLRHGGVDPGAANTAVVWIAEDPITHNYFVYREYHGPDETYAETAQKVLAYREQLGTWVGGSNSEEDRRREWARAGVGLASPLISDIETGIDRTHGLIKAKRLFLFDTCIYLRKELMSYSRETDPIGNPTDRIANKKDYHLVDALRYIASELASREFVKMAQNEEFERIELAKRRQQLLYVPEVVLEY